MKTLNIMIFLILSVSVLGFSINNGDTYTNSNIVQLNVSETGNCTYKNQGENISVTDICQSRSWQLIAGGGNRVVELNNGTLYSDSIILDATPPSLNIKIIGNSQQVVLNLTYSDNLAGVNACRYSNEDNNWSAWETCVSEKNWKLLNGTVYYQVSDNAGNIGQAFDNISISQNCEDNDNDGFTNCEECNDNNSSINPNATETCDLVDNNCNNQIDESCVTCESSLSCGEYESCTGGEQTRTCTDLCGNQTIETQTCKSESSGGGSRQVSSTSPIQNETKNQQLKYLTEWNCSVSDCQNGNQVKVCTDKSNSSNVARETIACRETVEQTKVEDNTTKIVQPKIGVTKLFPYILIIIAIVALLVLFLAQRESKYDKKYKEFKNRLSKL